MDFLCALQIQKDKRPKLFLAVSLFTNLSILGFFKYFNFFAESLQSLCSSVGWNLDGVTLNIILPVGISFYTFQSLSYTIDVFRGDLKASSDISSVALYVSFFPQLVAGPIERATHFLPQVTSPRNISPDGLASGIWLILLGYFKKLVLADNCAAIVDPCFSGDGLPFAGLGNWIILYAFAIQIYGDFSGYTDIARGTSKLLGFDLMRNFGSPYLVASPSAFWRHWHISLSSWLRDYLYIPLGGNRGSLRTVCRNLLITMTLGGLWHGAGWAFSIWGIFQGAVLVTFRLLPPRGAPTSSSTLSRVLRSVLFFHVTCIGWLIFRTGSLPKDSNQSEFLYNSAISLVGSGVDGASVLIRAVLPWIVCGFLCQAYYEQMERFHKWHFTKQSIAIASVLTVIATYGVFGGSSFIYFQF